MSHEWTPEQKQLARLAADGLISLVAAHEADDHDGAPCLDERAGVVAYVAHAVGLHPADLGRIADMLAIYDEHHEHHQPTRDDIRATQEAAVAAVEAALERGDESVEVEGRRISREAAWAGTQALRAAWATEGGRLDGPEREGDEWVARVEVGDREPRQLVRVPLGRFPG